MGIVRCEYQATSIRNDYPCSRRATLRSPVRSQARPALLPVLVPRRATVDGIRPRETTITCVQNTHWSPVRQGMHNFRIIPRTSADWPSRSISDTAFVQENQ